MMATVRSQTFTLIDTFWLNLEAPTSPTLIAGLLLFDEPVDFARLRAQIADRLLRFDRFLQRPRAAILPLTLPTWEPVPDFDLADHLHCTTLPAPAMWPQLKAFIEGLVGAPLPRNRPLWQFHLIERYGPGSALVVCYSHVLADGFASMHLLESITDLLPDAPPGASLLPASPALRAPSLAGRVAAAMGMAERAQHLRGALDLTRDPSPALRKARYRLEQGRAFARYVLMRPDRRTALRAPSSHAKRVAASEALDMTELKALTRAFGVTLNDLMGSLVAGAFRRYLAGRGEHVDGLTLHASMPYNLRPAERSGELGNGFSLVFLPLPVGVADPVERLRMVKAGADFVKSHPEAPTSYLVGRATGLLPAPWTRLAMQFFANKVSTVFTNVPGPAEPRYLAGRRIDRIMFWAPHACFLTMDASILSYAGHVTVCFNSDARAVPDLEVLVDGLAAEYAELRARSGLQPDEATAESRPGGEAHPQAESRLARSR